MYFCLVLLATGPQNWGMVAIVILVWQIPRPIFLLWLELFWRWMHDSFPSNELRGFDFTQRLKASLITANSLLVEIFGVLIVWVPIAPISKLLLDSPKVRRPRTFFVLLIYLPGAPCNLSIVLLWILSQCLQIQLQFLIYYLFRSCFIWIFWSSRPLLGGVQLLALFDLAYFLFD